VRERKNVPVTIGELLFRYLAARLRHPGSSAKRYIRAGLALEHRARTLSLFWSDHLSRSRAAQARWAQTASGDVLTVLGAGALADFNIPALSRRFKRFRLVDADPLSANYWARINMPVEPVIMDISGAMDRWCHAIHRSKAPWQQTLDLIRELGTTPVPAYTSSSDALLSLNVLSQLEVGLQEAVEPILKKHFGEFFVRRHEQEWLQAIGPASQSLAEQHLAAMQASQARFILLITDVEYADYTGRTYSGRQWDQPPLVWSETGWQAEPGIEYAVVPALEGVALNAPTFARWMPSYRLEWRESWLWHIAPNGTEAASYGKLHRVSAFALRHFKSVLD
jgi:hypothetical protein